ncbi:MAG: hypothetical protein R3B55_00905 [Candidatus Paceibacterota bacterium]
MSKKTIITLFVFWAFPFLSQAAVLDVRSSNPYPDVGDIISVSVSSFEIPVERSEVSWFKDGKFEKKGIGLKSFSFPVGENGNTIRVSVKESSKTTEQSIKINPSSMDILWEVVGGYEPPFYKGKVSPIKGSRIKVVAIPQIKNEKGYVLNSGNFVYSWKKDGSSFGGQSGYGQNSFLYAPDILDRENRIEVSASSLSRSLAKSLTISPTSSEIHFYEYSASAGPFYNKAIKNNQNFNTKKIGIIAEPYFIFTKSIKDPLLQTGWKINNLSVNTDIPNIAIINVADNVNTVDLNFKTDNKAQLLQENSRTIRFNVSNNE